MDELDRIRWENIVDAAVAVTSDLDLDSLLRRIIDQARELTGARYAALGVLGRDSDDELVEFLVEGIDPDTAESIGRLPRGHGVLGVVLRDGCPLRLEDVASHPDSVGFPPNHPPMGAFLGVPVRVNGVVFGDLYLTEKTGGFTADDERLVTGLAAVAGTAISNARLFDELASTRAELTRLAVIEDRNRIARDLHDLVIGRLFAAGLAVDRVARHVPEPWAERASQAVDDVDRAIADLRGAIFALGSDPATDGARLVRMLKATAAPLGFAPTIEVQGDLAVLDIGLRSDVHAVMNEALANVIRHAHASKVDLCLDVEPDRVVASVTDDGIGMGDHVPASGLANLQERARRAGGTLTIEPGPEGVGTRLVWSVPVGNGVQTGAASVG
ncbi:GAF domain-containing protein [Aeromicrobium senzhongii]|uniref:GAF domain-containing protein n=1 Tax=Aeromicrobium senzhongii TaxID=2663859 RepID=A0ABX6ST69_9ACTN|nr:GAF domain-containing protein [Aeromicrobium senzhongii]QNL94447.1 GAF domain-containing protein [Aeromicrobium senzhongii]